jgi:hypothetical protein
MRRSISSRRYRVTPPTRIGLRVPVLAQFLTVRGVTAKTVATSRSVRSGRGSWEDLAAMRKQREAHGPARGQSPAFMRREVLAQWLLCANGDTRVDDAVAGIRRAVQADEQVAHTAADKTAAQHVRAAAADRRRNTWRALSWLLEGGLARRVGWHVGEGLGWQVWTLIDERDVPPPPTPIVCDACQIVFVPRRRAHAWYCDACNHGQGPPQRPPGALSWSVWPVFEHRRPERCDDWDRQHKRWCQVCQGDALEGHFEANPGHDPERHYPDPSRPRPIAPESRSWSGVATFRCRQCDGVFSAGLRGRRRKYCRNCASGRRRRYLFESTDGNPLQAVSVNMPGRGFIYLAADDDGRLRTGDAELGHWVETTCNVVRVETDPRP